MQHYIDSGKVRRNGRIATVLAFAGLAFMIAGIVLAFTRREEFTLVLVVSFTGLTFSQVGTLMRNRWSRHPRTDEILDDALKGMDDRYAIFHYLLGASHALVGPPGILAVCTSDVDGEIRYEAQRWIRLRPKPGLLSRSRVQRLSDPGGQTQSEVDLLRKTLKRRLRLPELPEVTAILVFVHQGALIEAEDSPFPAVHVKKLKAYLRALPKGHGLSPDQIEALAQKHR